MASGSTHTLKLGVNGRERQYALHVPLHVAHPAPLVLAFHGGGGHAGVMLDKARWAAKADQEGFVVCAPEGTPGDQAQPATFRFNPKLWNTGGAATAAIARLGVDDVAFTRIRAQRARYYNDSRRTKPGEINHLHGRRAVYFDDPSGHLMEIITHPHGERPQQG